MMKQTISNYLKNIPGWQTNRKLVIFSVDDYGNVRLDSKAARDNLRKDKISLTSHFDRLDTLETRDDLESLYTVLSSVQDKHGNPAIFTPYALTCNIDFEAMANNGYSEYVYELLPKTYEKLSLKDSTAYTGTWELWKEGIDKGLMKPQFHGREHFNLNIFNDLLKKRSENLLKVLEQDSYVSIPDHRNYKNGWTAAYSFDDKKETEGFLDNVRDGLKMFKEVYGFDSKVFTPPAQQFPLHLEPKLSALGLEYIDRPRSLKRHLGNGRYQMEKHKLGGGTTMLELVRNVVFEPSSAHISNWVDFSFRQIEAAFFWKKPANISSHRVNFCGHIDPENRKTGLTALKQLLDKIVKRWPEVEFISADQLGDIIKTNNK
ncbi:hypothetical protein M8845_04385 [Gelidibacter japonicus]|uniref:hypothetical protein n=1 Tax=Gelidibacter japonicus TaxID=1962232 RepID=UPI0020229256|nr:hypothetical protein [Gelidibacter japonicus]MCL8006660.1 hypothetical protein [Gelidibacter japonicus]